MNALEKKRGTTVRAIAGHGVTRRKFLTACAASAIGAPALIRLAHGAGKKTSITYWNTLDHNDANPRSRGEKAMVDAFRKKYPDIEVNIQTVPWQKMVQQIIQAAGAGKSPDVANASDRGLSTLVAAKAIMPLDEHVGKSWTKEQKQDWLLPVKNTVFDGRTMGMFWHTQHNNLLFVNKAMLTAKSGGKLPRTWEEMAHSAKAMTDGRIVGYLIGASKDGNAAQLTQSLIPCLWSAGADWLDDKDRVAFNTENGLRMFQWLYDMVHTHKVMPEGMVSVTRDNMLDAFKSGTAAMICLTTTSVAAIRQGPTGKDMLLTSYPGVTAQKPLDALVSGKFLVMGKDCREREAAGIFIEDQVSPDAQMLNAKIAGELPSRKSALRDPFFNTPEAADMKFQVTDAERAGRTMPYHPKHNVISDLVAEAVQQMITKRKTIKAALDEVTKRWESEIG
jgi:multiple sugar transport system substrate-binding protein